MRDIRRVVLVFLIMLGAAFAHAEPAQEALTLQEAFVNVSKDVGPAVVSISTEHIERYQTRYYPFSQDQFFDDFFNDFFVSGPDKEFKRAGLGSGVIIDKEGYILTNEHVVRGADRITVTLADGREFGGHLTGSDEYSDLAVIKIEPKGDLPFAGLGDSEKVRIGQWAIAIGNPFAFAVRNPEPTVTVGVVSALHRSLPRTDKRLREYSDLIQTDAAINPGNSGGPLVNIHGEIIGINVAIFTLSGGSEGIGFAIPANTAKKVVDDLIQGRKVLYGWIGVIIQDIDSDIAAYFGLQDKNGVLISRIVEDSPAEKSGLRSGDIIVFIDGEKVKNTQDLIRMIVRKEIGDKVRMDVIREAKIYPVNVEIAARPDDKIIFSKKKLVSNVNGKSKAGGADFKDIKIWRGLEVMEVTTDMADRLKLNSVSGVMVKSIDNKSPVAAAGLRPGDIIYEINRVPIKNMVDYKIAVSGVSGDVLIGTYRGFVVVKEK
ncbi:MAG: trypsin-like peptidase domain-containing protein [Candidatus Omnitrophota bacterium]